MKKRDEDTNNAEDTGGAKDQAADNEQAHDRAGEDELTPYDQKIGERPDNLSRRSDWFQKRCGGR